MACFVGKDNLWALFFKPSAPNVIIAEISNELTDEKMRQILGRHDWSEVFVSREDDEVVCSLVFLSTFRTRREVEKTGWRTVDITDDIFKGFNPAKAKKINYPYPETTYCEPPLLTGEVNAIRLFRFLPANLFPEAARNKPQTPAAPVAPPKPVARVVPGSAAAAGLPPAVKKDLGGKGKKGKGTGPSRDPNERPTAPLSRTVESSAKAKAVHRQPAPVVADMYREDSDDDAAQYMAAHPGPDRPANWNADFDDEKSRKGKEKQKIEEEESTKNMEALYAEEEDDEGYEEIVPKFAGVKIKEKEGPVCPEHGKRCKTGICEWAKEQKRIQKRIAQKNTDKTGQWVRRCYWIPTAGIISLLYSLNFIANGRKNPRDRDMHGRVVLLTGAFTPLGLTLMHELAQRGAQIIALAPSLNDPVVEEIISAIRVVTSNELIFAEECDLTSPASIRAFCKQFLSTTTSGPSSSVPGAPRDPPRLDAVILTHEYTHIGALWTSNKDSRRIETERRFEGTERPRHSGSECREPAIRGFRSYVSTSSCTFQTKPEYRSIEFAIEAQLARMAIASISSREGERALRSILLMRHLQRVVDALASQSTKPVIGTSDADTVDVKKSKTSNILAVSVAPGFSRPQTIGAYLRASRESEDYTRLGVFLYILLFPIIVLFSKSSNGAAQTVLYALFAPTLRTRITETPEGSPASKPKTRSSSQPIPRIQGGILYRECAPTRIPGRGAALMEAEAIGRGVWEEMERGVEIWEKSEGEVLREMAKEVEKEGKDSRDGHNSSAGPKGKAE
ncbi:short chain dehydrogenase [Ceratobasidium sp. AG-Ba]|nr:short chain dehydrogenase [Ceratobasidium sp. AG-Ba]